MHITKGLNHHADADIGLRLSRRISQLAEASDTAGLGELYQEALQMRAQGEEVLEGPLVHLLNVLDYDREQFDGDALLLRIWLERAAVDAEYLEAVARAEHAAVVSADENYHNTLTAARGY